jgi:protoporphyrinogen oxidase
LAEEVVAGGGMVALGTGVVELRHDRGRVTAVVVERIDGRRDVLNAEQYVSSLPMPLLARLLRPAAPAAVLAAAEALTFRDLITVHLMLRRPRVTPDTWLYVHEPSIPFGRLHEPKNWSPAMVPDADHTSLVAEYFCSRGDTLWARSDDDLCDLTVHHLQRTLGFLHASEVVGAFAVRSPRAYPTYHLGYGRPLTVLKSYAASFSNLQLIGRGGAFRYNNADHAIESGLLAARNVLGGRYDLDGVNAAAEYLEARRSRPAEPRVVEPRGGRGPIVLDEASS